MAGMNVQWSNEKRIQFFTYIMKCYKIGSVRELPDDFRYTDADGCAAEWLRIYEPEVYAARVAAGRNPASAGNILLGWIFNYMQIRPGTPTTDDRCEMLKGGYKQFCNVFKALTAAINAGFISESDFPDEILMLWQPKRRAAHAATLKAAKLTV